MKPCNKTALGLAFTAMCSLSLHADSSSEIHELLEATGVVAQVEVLRELVVQSSDTNAARCGANAGRTPVPSFSPDSIIYDTLKAFDGFNDADTPSLLQWFSSPLAQKIHKAEQSNARPEDGQEHTPSVLPSKDRYHQIRNIINNTRTIEFITIIGSEIEYAGLLHSGCIAKAQINTASGNKNPEQILAESIRGDTVTAIILTDSITSDLAYLLRELTDSELASYEAFTASPAAQRFYSQLIEALEYSVRLASDRINIASAHGSLDD